MAAASVMLKNGEKQSETSCPVTNECFLNNAQENTRYPETRGIKKNVLIVP